MRSPLLPSSVPPLVEALQAATLPRAEWTHRAHLVAGAWYVVTHGLEQACAAMPPTIRRYNVACGVANTDSSGYHETLTIAYLREIARQWTALPAGSDLNALIAHVCSSALADSDWPHRYWSRERLWSVAARRTWIEPDLQPLPV